MKNPNDFPRQMILRGRPFARWLNERKLLLLLTLVATLIYSSFSILHHRHFFSSAFDLGIFDQAIWHYSRFETPYSSIRSNVVNENILGDHFHPILILLAPLYWFTDSVEALLAAQALLFAIPIIPIFLFTEKRLGKLAAYLFALSYSVFWGIQQAVEFDFHEIAFAVPLIALAIYFIDEKRWKAYFVCAGLLLLTKEDLSVLVAFFGFYLITLRQFRKGLVSIALGIVWFFLAIKLFIPFFSGENGYHYWSYKTFGSDPLSSLVTIIKDPLLMIRTLFSPAVKLHTWWYMFFPFLFLAFFSPLIILAIPLIAERFLSDSTHFWAVAFHYTATISPVIVMASADGLTKLTGFVKAVKLRRVIIIAASCIILSLNLYLLPQFPLWNLTSYGYWHRGQSDKAGYAALSLIPRDASVAAQANIVPHLSHRRRIFLIRPVLIVPDSEYIIAGRQINPYPFPTFEGIEEYLAEQQEDYSKVFERDGWIVLKRNRPIAKQTAAPLKGYGDIPALVSAIYRQVLGREPDAGGLALWSEYIRTHRASIKSVVKQFALSDEFTLMLGQQETTEVGVHLIYRRLLAREPTADELAKSMEIVQSGGFRALILKLLNSVEYETRFGECGVPGETVLTDSPCLELQE